MVRRAWVRGRLMGLTALAFAVLSCGPALAKPCDGMMPDTGAAPANAIAAEDLIRLRDISYSHLPPAQRLFSLSPDGRRIAFAMHRADIDANAYCQAIIIVDLDRARAPGIVDSGDELLLEAYPIRDVRVDYGYPRTILPAWSPDGRWVAYLKRVDGRTALWRAPTNGGPAQPVTRSDDDVELFAWNTDSRKLVFATQPGIDAQQRAIEREGREGYVFDERIIPYAGPRPAIRLPEAYRFWTVDTATGTTREATPDETAHIALPPPMDPSQNLQSATSVEGRRAWIARSDPSAYLSNLELWAETPDGRKVRCPEAACQGTRSFGITRLWWLADGRTLLFLRREGWAGSRTALYRWSPGKDRTARILVTDDILVGCELAATRLLCAREGSTQPRRLVRIDTKTGKHALLFDPNPGFASLRLGTVERLHWRNSTGVETFGDLVLPPGHRRQDKLPLVIVQYQSTGFLRGGIGDEYPIQLFANAGYAVLSFNAPPAFAEWDGSKRSFEDAVVQTTRGWRSRRAIFDSLVTGIDLLVARGIVDPARIGITGFSDGATTVQFALVNRPDLFAAAAISSCCTDPSFFMIYGGIGLADAQKQLGFPPGRGPDVQAWKPISIALNGDVVRAPLLMQLADHEYLGGIDSFMSLRDQHKPVEMHVFPQEYHLKWQPAHRAAIYRRSLDWFNFWLQDKIDPDPSKMEQYRRWRELRHGGSSK